MASFIPQLQRSSPRPAPEPRVVALDDEEIDGLLETLSSDTRRTILLSLYESPATPAELTAEADSSLQNVHYHLERLQAANLVEVVDTRYSEKGTEMSVFAPTNDPLIFVESRDTQSWIRSMLPSFLGGVGVVGLVAVLVQWLADTLTRPMSGAAVEYTMTTDAAVSRAAPSLTDQLTTLLLEPGMLVFVGGLLALLAVLALGVYANRRHERTII